MIILLRISPKSFNKPLPLGLANKGEAVQLSLYSLIKAGIDGHKVVIISDQWTRASVPFHFDEWLDKDNFGNEGTFKSQTQYSQSLPDNEIVLYCEDDYLWRPNTLDTLERACKVLGFVSPYDHPAHYQEERFDKHYLTALINGYTFRTSPSNTLTFAAPVHLIKKHYNTLVGYGIQDHEMWQSIISTDPLWCPCYSMATHLVDGCLAPNIDWQSMV